MIAFDDAVRIVTEIAKPLPSERIPLGDADGRVLSLPVVADFAFPPHPSSAMDGYAVRDDDLVPLPAALKVAGVSYAGAAFAGSLRPGSCIRVFTGAKLPAGATRVVIQEDVEFGDGTARFHRPPSPRRHIRQAGSDFECGEILLPAGVALNPQRLVTAAAADQASVTVVRRPRVLTIVSGDELVPAGARCGRQDKIADSLSLAISALVRRWNGEVVENWLCGDDLAMLQRTAEAAVTRADVVVLTGGASVGEKDFAKAMFTPLGLQFCFNKVAIRPGKPIWLGQIGKTLIMGLPGNPTSALVTARLLLAPLLTGLSGNAPQTAWRWSQMRLAAPLGGGGEREQFLRAEAKGDVLHPLDDQSSAAQKALATADYLIRQRPQDKPRDAGATAEALPF